MAELSIEIPWFLLQILLHITNIINCLIDVLLLPSLSHKVTLFHLYKLRMNNLFCYFNFVGYFLSLGVDGKSLWSEQEFFVPASIFNLTGLPSKPFHTLQSSGHQPISLVSPSFLVFLTQNMQEHFALPAPALLRPGIYSTKASWDKGTGFLSQKGE